MNTQSRSGPNLSLDQLKIVELFYTLQGEGPAAGSPAVFIRLAGCNLQCPACDTDYTTGTRVVSVYDVYNEAVELVVNAYRSLPAKCLFVITGGEPLLQYAVSSLANMLGNAFASSIVQIETNGTTHPRWNIDKPWLEIIVSPKTHYVAKSIADNARAWKYVGKAGQLAEWDGLPLRALDNAIKGSRNLCRPSGPSAGEVYLQPLDEKDPEKNAANLRAVTESCLRYGYRLSVQLHKLAGIP